MLINWIQITANLSTSPETFFKYYLSTYGITNFAKFFNKCINCLFENDRMLSWAKLKDEHELVDDMFFPVCSVKTSKSCKIKDFNYSNLNEYNVYQNHHVTQEGRNLSLGKMSPKYMYFSLISNTVNAAISNRCFEFLFTNTTLDLSKTYLLPRLAVIDTTFGFFQNKILNNVLFLKKKKILLQQ